MTSPTYNILHQIMPVTLDANGNGSANIGPSNVYEYWAPLIIRVATKTNPPPSSKCTVFHGATGVQDFTTYLDDTNTGNSDTTTMCAGITLQFGQVITAAWTGGTPNDNAILIIDGILTNTPPNLGQLPQVPGAHFAGKGTGETTAILSSNGISGTNIAPSTTFAPPTVDVRQFNSYYLKVNSTDTGSPTQFDTMEVQISFFSDAAFSNLLFGDSYEFWANTSFGVGFTGGDVYVQDAMHGPFMQLQFFNNGTVNQHLKYQLVGSTRDVQKPTARQGFFDNPTFGFDQILIDVASVTVPAGGAVDRPLLLSYGEVGLVFVNNSANPIPLWLGFGSYSGLTDENFLQSVPANSSFGRTVPLVYTFPKRAGIMRIFSATAGSNYSFRAISNLNKM